MYLPKSQYTKRPLEEVAYLKIEIAKGNTSSDQETLDKIERSFQNPYTEIVVTSFGKLYSTEGIDFTKGDFSNAIELKKVSGNSDPTLSDNDQGNLIKGLKLPPTSEDRRNGVMVRCFYNNKCTGQLFEISKTQLTKLYRTQDKCVSTASINWIIKGPAQNQTLNGYFLEGVASLNQKTVNQLATIIPGIEAILPDPTEYLEELTIPGAQQPQTTPLGLNIPAPSK